MAIDKVFQFKVGDVVRLRDGDGRPHVIKMFEKITGIHGPDFYHVIFEDNTASDHIIPGKEYPGGYFTCMEKIGITCETTVERTPLNGPNGIVVYLNDFDGFRNGDKVIVQVRKK